MIETIYSDFKSFLCIAILFGIAYFCFGIAIRFSEIPEDPKGGNSHDLAKRD